MTAIKPSELKDIIAAFRKLKRSYEESGKALSGLTDTTKHLKSLIGEPNTNAKGSRLITAGVALIALPDPTITDLIGATLVAAGLLKNRMRPLTVTDTCREFRESIRMIENMKRGLLEWSGRGRKT